MASRMDRYKEETTKVTSTRSTKYKNLYNSLDNNPTYTTISDVRNSNAYSLSEDKSTYKTREGYQKIKDYDNFVEKPKIQKELDDFNYVYKDKEKKVYDINSVIEEAKKKKEQTDDAPKKLKDNSLTLTKEDIERYKKAKSKKTVLDEEEKKMKELINTITSKTLRGEIDQATSVDLLSDLMATSKMDAVKNSNDILDTKALGEVKTEMKNYDENKEKEEKNKEIKNIDNSFYTKSMDLSDKDFVMDDEFLEDEDKIPNILKLILVLLIAALLGILVYFIFKSF